MNNPIVEAILEDEDFQEKLTEVAKSINMEDKIDAAISEHDTVLNLIGRVERLETVFKMGKTVEQMKRTEPPKEKPVGGLRQVVAPGGAFQVMEDENYRTFLTREQDYKWEVFGLYQVTFRLPALVTCYVLAESPEGAVSQASCVFGPGELIGMDKGVAEETATVTRLPLMLRSWSSRQF